MGAIPWRFDSSHPHHNMKVGYDYPGITIVYFYHDGKGNFIMAKRSKNTRDEHNRWDIGAGGLELGETIDTTLRREIKEEYCTDVLDYTYLGFRELHRTHKDKKTHWIGLDFKVLINPKKVANGEPHKFDQIAWFTLSKVPNRVHSQFPGFLEKYKDKL